MSRKKTYEFTLEIFRKHYCPFCGNKLIKKKRITILYKGDEGFSKHHSVGYNPFINKNENITYYFYCNDCCKSFSEHEVGKIRKLQKKAKSKILNQYTNNEITYVKQQKLLIACNRILKMRWLLLIPLIGSLICNFAIFNGCLQQKTEDKDLYKLTLSSIAFLFGAELISGFALMFINIDIIENYKTTIMMILSLLAFNLPTLWYINHTFKRK